MIFLYYMFQGKWLEIQLFKKKHFTIIFIFIGLFEFYNLDYLLIKYFRLT